MSYIVVDVESDGPIPHQYSMISFGAVILDSTLDKTFYGKVKPVSPFWIPEALAVSGFSRQQHENFDEPLKVMQEFLQWIKVSSLGKPVFISDNVAFDWQWINYYFHFYLKENPFGFSGRRISDLYCGMKLDTSRTHEWKKLLRKTKHDHNPVNDALGNAEALLEMKKMGLKIPIL
jgi:DNA polymerase III epsilon subunit-like protein